MKNVSFSAASSLQVFFCSTALTSAGWVRTTVLSIGTVHQQLSSAAIIESQQEIFLIKNVRSRESYPGRQDVKRKRYLCAMPTPWQASFLYCAESPETLQ